MINQKAGYVTPGSWFPGPAEIKRRERNRARLESKRFTDACEMAGIPATKRQASKFNNGRGLAFRFAR